MCTHGNEKEFLPLMGQIVQLESHHNYIFAEKYTFGQKIDIFSGPLRARELC